MVVQVEQLGLRAPEAHQLAQLELAVTRGQQEPLEQQVP